MIARRFLIAAFVAVLIGIHELDCGRTIDATAWYLFAAFLFWQAQHAQD